MGLGSVSLNMFWSPSISGSNFLQASMGKINTYATTLNKVNILGATKFSLLNRNIKQLDNHLGKIRGKTAKISANPIRLDIKTSSASLKEARKDMTAIERDAKQTAFWSKKSADNLQRGAKASKKATTKNRPQIGAGAMVGAVGVVGAMTLPFKASIDFESNMADVKALTKNITAEDFTLLSAKAKELGATTEWSASESALGMTYLAKAGFDTKQQLGAMGGVLGLATAGSVDLGVASDIGSNILSSFSIEAEKMGMVSDVLAKTFSSSNTDLVMLGETMKYAAPVASGLGSGLTEVSALAGKLGDVGIQGSMAGTGIASMYSRLSAPPSEARKSLEALGISAYDAQGKFKGMPNIIGELNKSMVGMGDENKMKHMKNIFGMTALKSGIALMKVGKKGLLDYKSTLDNSAGTTKNIQDIKLATTEGQFILLSSAMEGLSISATFGLLPAIRSITNGFRSVATGLDSFVTSYPNVSKWVFGLGAAFVIGSIALAGFGFVASGVATALGAISLPIIGVIAGITAIGVGAVYLYNKFASVRNGVNSFFSGISDSLSIPMLEIQLLFSAVGSSLSRFFSSLSPVFSAFGSILGGLGINFKSVGFVIGSAFSIAMIPIKLLLVAMSSVLDMVSMVIEGYTKIAQLASVAGSTVADGASSAWSGTKSFFGFGDDKKASIPANNLDYKKDLLKTSSLKEMSIPKIPLESVSNVTAKQINETKTQMQNSSSNKAVQQTIHNQITVTTTDGIFNEDDFKNQVAKALKENAHDEQDMQMQDVS